MLVAPPKPKAEAGAGAGGGQGCGRQGQPCEALERLSKAAPSLAKCAACYLGLLGPLSGPGVGPASKASPPPPLGG